MSRIMHGEAVPAPSGLQVILRKTAETLARELAQPTQSAPEWSDVEWTVARATAAMHGISPLLARRLRWRGPADWSNFLEQQRTHTAVRHERILKLLEGIDQRAREAGIAIVGLKGVALHAATVYRPGERPMADVDLLVRPRDVQAAAKLIESLGYCRSYASWKETVFTPLVHQRPGGIGEHAGNDIKIELHERICEMLPWRITDVSEQIFPTDPQAGLNDYPSRASLMIHLLLHAAGAIAHQAFRILHAHDIALLSSRMTGADWNDFLHAGTGRRALWWALPPLRLTSKYYCLTIPDDVLRSLARKCPWVLSRVSRNDDVCDVSYSHLWVDAFPGIEWSQSMPELLQYAASRVRPSHRHMALREIGSETQAWAGANDWSALSQSRRILRWVMSRPTRPVTMHAVNAAIAQSQ